MIDTRTALMQAILDEPDDDGPRLIFADYLDEQGECDRAEFIRVQCTLAEWHTPPGSGSEDFRYYRRLKKREGEIIGKCGPAWASLFVDKCQSAGWIESQVIGVGPLSCFVYDKPGIQDARFDITFRRGFVHTIRCKLLDFRKYGPDIVKLHPIQWVEPTDVTIIQIGDGTFCVSRCFDWQVDTLLSYPFWTLLNGHASYQSAATALSVLLIGLAKKEDVFARDILVRKIVRGDLPVPPFLYSRPT